MWQQLVILLLSFTYCLGASPCYEEIKERLELQNQSSYTTVPFRTFSIWIDDTKDHLKHKITQGESWERKVATLLQKLIKPGDTVVDAGAHIGLHTLLMSKCAGRAGRVYAFEPQKKLFNELSSNLLLNECSNVIPYHLALSQGTASFHLDKPSHNEGACRIDPMANGELIEAKALDSFQIENVSLIKIDVEGHEYHLLRGAANTIKYSRPYIIIEIWSENSALSRGAEYNRLRVFQLLEEWGYYVEKISKDDFLAIPLEKQASTAPN